MTDLRKTIVPKSDQLNFDDLIGGRTLTIKVTKVTGTDGDQPISIHFEGDNGKPYKPCKSMRRVLIQVWGDKAEAFVGRSMTLYGDPTVKFGGAEVGGIRISHVSGIDKDMTMALTATRASRKPYTVKPLKDATAPPAAPQPASTAIAELKSEATDLAREIEMSENPAQLDKVVKRCDLISPKLIEAKMGGWHDKLVALIEQQRGKFQSSNPVMGR